MMKTSLINQSQWAMVLAECLEQEYLYFAAAVQDGMKKYTFLYRVICTCGKKQEKTWRIEEFTATGSTIHRVTGNSRHAAVRQCLLGHFPNAIISVHPLLPAIFKKYINGDLSFWDIHNLCWD
jgi:hypothetical protein